MSNVTVTVNQANITVDEGNTNVAVTTTTSNVTVAELPIISNTIIRASLSVTDTGGDGSLAYDNTNGVFTYTGVSAAETRAHFSATAPVMTPMKYVLRLYLPQRIFEYLQIRVM